MAAWLSPRTNQQNPNPMYSFERNRNLTDGERFRRIGELLAIAIIRYRHLHPEEFEKHSRSCRPSHQHDPDRLVADESEKRILSYLSVVGTATPKDFRMALGMPRMSVTRKLERLRSAKLVTASGKTRAVRYALAEAELTTQP
ncbi:hypothetical protein OpiT1DRAFT_03764 [Opitutaceae bacterium TAV1]|nr:hypothetical protein OpiT1DRAFT_03764 [Opitutaceae bacterium TAV1]